MKPLGSIVSLYYDGFDVVEVDEVIQTQTGRSYRCISNRVQEKGKYKSRQHIKALVIDQADITEDDVVHPLYWYRR